MREIWKKHKGAIIAAVLGSSITACVSLSMGLYSLNKSISYQQTREVLNSTRLAIGFLQNVQTEIDANANLLQIRDYRGSAEFGDPFSQTDMVAGMLKAAEANPTNAMTPAEKKAASEWVDSMNNMFGKVVRVEKIDYPQETLSTIVWDHGAPEIADIDYELLRDLTIYYLAVHRLNATITAMTAQNVQPGSAISVQYSQKIQKMLAVNNENVSHLTEKFVSDLNHKIEMEKQRLHDIRMNVLARH